MHTKKIIISWSSGNIICYKNINVTKHCMYRNNNHGIELFKGNYTELNLQRCFCQVLKCWPFLKIKQN